MKQIIMKVLFSVLFLAVFASIQVFAGNESLAHGVDLHPNEEVVYSDICLGTHKYIWGRNSDYSKHRVWFVAETYVNGSWIEDDYARKLISAGDQLEETSTYEYSGTHVWHLKVDAYGWYSGCTATGYIRNK